MTKSRCRFNAKARASADTTLEDTNALVIDPNEKKETITKKENEEPKMNAKKRKRLEKYIANKMKKEKRVELFEKLRTSSFKSELLKPTKELGKTRFSLKEKMRKNDLCRNAGMEACFSDSVISIPEVVEEISEEEEEDKENLVSEVDEEQVVENIEENIEVKVEDEKKEEEEKKEVEENPLIERITVVKGVERKVFHVPVQRSKEMEERRQELPVCGMEQEIMEAIYENDVVILCGETGSGKTTQVPQFLYEAGFGNKASGKKRKKRKKYVDYKGMIGITQPRRVAAVSMAQRVGEEMNCKDVSYQIRYDSTVDSNTAIKFMTDGVLLKEMSCDFLLEKYSAIIIDEAHERSLNTDILIGLLSRLTKVRRKKGNPLKMIVMSATLRVQDFSENTTLFETSPPVLHVASRQYPVTVHFSKVTPSSYVEAAYSKICKIHERLPPGGILVFLTGRQEIHSLMKKLGSKNTADTLLEKDEDDPWVFDLENEEDGTEEEKGDEFSDVEESCENVIPDQKLHVLPLYSMLPTQQQMKVFEDPPANSRLCVLATNVAETSLTIPNIRYVVDCGKVKEKEFEGNGVQRFGIEWISKASAEQRAGRAGRTGPGHCYRLYSSAVFDQQFPDFSRAEIERIPMEGIVLQMKNMHIDNVVHFPFPSSPNREQLASAEKLLSILGALDVEKKVITETGRNMAVFPLHPRLSKMILLGLENASVTNFIVSLVSILSVGDVYADKPKMITNEKSDLINLLALMGALDFELTKDANSLEPFCRTFHLHSKLVKEALHLRSQLMHVIHHTFGISVKDLSEPPSKAQMKQIKQIALSCFPDQIVKWDADERCYKSVSSNEPLYIHNYSCLVDAQLSSPYLLYSHLLRNFQGRVFLHNVTEVSPHWISTLAASMCSFSKPLESPSPSYHRSSDEMRCHVTATYGSKWNLPCTEVSFPDCSLRYRWFLKSLLEGAVIDAFLPYTDKLTSKPTLVLRPWAQSKIVDLLLPLSQNKISSKKLLIEKWKVEPSFLLQGFLQWIPSELHSSVMLSWPFLE